MIRGDLSNRLIHLTKDNTHAEASHNFLNIYKHGKLRGDHGDIRGGYNCVCFSEAPISIISQMISNPPKTGVRYAPLGVMVSKTWLFQKGGRPVIYQPNKEYDLLPEELKFRHVCYDPIKGIDHTWEREWRIRTDELTLDPDSTTLVVPRRNWVEMFKDEHASEQGLFASGYVVALINKLPWHFIVLEDLGVEIDWPDPS